jgi:hypothetical protein
VLQAVADRLGDLRLGGDDAELSLESDPEFDEKRLGFGLTNEAALCRALAAKSRASCAVSSLL